MKKGEDMEVTVVSPEEADASDWERILRERKSKLESLTLDEDDNIISIEHFRRRLESEYGIISVKGKQQVNAGLVLGDKLEPVEQSQMVTLIGNNSYTEESLHSYISRKRIPVLRAYQSVALNIHPESQMESLDERAGFFARI